MALAPVEVEEVDPPPGVEPVRWRPPTTHAVLDAETAWQVAGWRQARWTVERLFRPLRRQGLDLAGSQLADASRLGRLAAVAAAVAAPALQLVQARDGTGGEPAIVAFEPDELALLDALGPDLEGRTALQQKPAPGPQPRLGGLDHRPARRLGRLPLRAPAARADHPQARAAALPGDGRRVAEGES